MNDYDQRPSRAPRPLQGSAGFPPGTCALPHVQVPPNTWPAKSRPETKQVACERVQVNLADADERR